MPALAEALANASAPSSLCKSWLEETSYPRGCLPCFCELRTFQQKSLNKSGAAAQAILAVSEMCGDDALRTYKRVSPMSGKPGRRRPPAVQTVVARKRLGCFRATRFQSSARQEPFLNHHLRCSRTAETGPWDLLSLSYHALAVSIGVSPKLATACSRSPGKPQPSR
jgi:hypothetical protein